MKKIIFLFIIFILTNSTQLFSNTCYGDQEPTGAVLNHFKPKKATDWDGMFFEGWEERQNLAIIVHVIGDSLTDTFSRKSYKKSLVELNKETRQKGLIFWLDESHKKPVLLISAVSINKIKEELNSNDEFLSVLNKMWELGDRTLKSVDKYNYTDKYSVNVLKEKSAYLLYYGSKQGLSSSSNGGWSLSGPHTIYYKNINGEDNLTAVRIMGKYKGDPNKTFYFIIKDIYGNPIALSSEYKIKEFPKDRFAMREFKIFIPQKIDEFYIEVYTDSSKKDGLFITCIPSKVRYSSGVELKNENWSIFPKFEEENNNISNIINNGDYYFSLDESKNSSHLVYKKGNLKYNGMLNITKEVIKKLDTIKIGKTTSDDLINILGESQIIEVDKKMERGAFNCKYGDAAFTLENNVIVGYYVKNILSPVIYGDSVRIGSSIEDVFDLVGKPKKTLVGANFDEDAIKDQVFYRDINGWIGNHSYSINSLGVRFYFWNDKVSAISLSKLKNSEEPIFKFSYKENKKIDSVSFILKNTNIYHLASKESSDSFWGIFEPLLYQVHVNGFGSYSFFGTDREAGMNKNFSIISYIKENEDRRNFYQIVELFFDMSREEIDSQVSETTSLIFYKEREGTEPILLLAAWDEENMRKVYESLKNKTTINEGMYILNHKEE